MANDFLYVFCKGGDKRPNPGTNKEYLGLFHGMVVDAFDPYLRYGKNDIIGDLEKKVFAVLKCPKTWTQQIQDAIQTYQVGDIDLNQVSSLRQYRQRKGYIDFEELGVLLNMLTLDSDILSPNVVPILDCSKLTPSIFKDATKKDFVHLSSTKDFNAHTEGTFTFGDTGSGDDFDTLALSCADIGNTTNDLTYGHEHSNIETSWAGITEIIGDGHTLKLTNNNSPAGDPTAGNKLTVLVNNWTRCLYISAEGSGVANTGILEVGNLNWDHSTNANNAKCITVESVVTPFNLHIHDMLMKGLYVNVESIRAFEDSDGTPIVYFHNNVIWNYKYGIYLTQSNVSSIYENSTIHHMVSDAFYVNSKVATFRNNTASDCAVICWRSNANADGYNNASTDATGEDGDFADGSGNNSNITIGDEVLSVDDTLSTFMDIKAGGVCEEGGTAPGIADNTSGIRGRPRISVPYSIGAAEALHAITVEAVITLDNVSVIGQEAQADVLVSRSENSIQTVGQAVQKDAQSLIDLDSIMSIVQQVQKDAQSEITLDSIAALQTVTQLVGQAILILDSVSAVTLVAIITAIMTPDKRTLKVFAEDRTMKVYKENRTLSIPIENRTLHINKSGRTIYEN